MADITMCKGIGCVIKGNCYRHNAVKSDYRQSYFDGNPINPITKDCKYFWRDK